MFNGFCVGKRMEEEERLRRDREKAREEKRRGRKRRAALMEGYESRVNHFMMTVRARQMLEQPQEIQSKELKEPTKFKGAPRFLLNGFPTERLRIEAELAKNQFLDLEPSPRHPPFRPSDPSKCLHPSMRFGSINSLDRLRDASLYPNIVSAMQLERPTLKRAAGRNNDSSQRIDMEVDPRSIYPSLHRKTHFKAIVSSLMLGSDNHREKLEWQNSENRKLARESVLRKGTVSKEEVANVAVEVLQSCKMQPRLDRDFLRCGGGKLVGNPDSTVGEVYSRLGSLSHSTTSFSLRAGVIVQR